MINLNDYSIFKNSIKTLKESSYDNSNNEYMTESNIKVVDFDIAKDKYIAEHHLSNTSVHSVDALSHNNDSIIMIEFKNGEISNSNIRWKILESLLLFCDVTNRNTTYTRDNVEFILVYNENNYKSDKVSCTIDGAVAYLSKLAKTKNLRFGLENYYRMLFKDAYTMSSKEFNEYEKNLISL